MNLRVARSYFVGIYAVTNELSHKNSIFVCVIIIYILLRNED